jgi:putative transposase
MAPASRHKVSVDERPPSRRPASPARLAVSRFRSNGPPALVRVSTPTDSIPRKAGAPQAQGQSVADAVRSIGVTKVTYYRWRQEFGGLKSDQVKRLKDLETENQRLRKAIGRMRLRLPRCGERSLDVSHQWVLPSGLS